MNVKSPGDDTNDLFAFSRDTTTPEKSTVQPCVNDQKKERALASERESRRLQP